MFAKTNQDTTNKKKKKTNEDAALFYSSHPMASIVCALKWHFDVAHCLCVEIPSPIDVGIVSVRSTDVEHGFKLNNRLLAICIVVGSISVPR